MKKFHNFKSGKAWIGDGYNLYKDTPTPTPEQLAEAFAARKHVKEDYFSPYLWKVTKVSDSHNTGGLDVFFYTDVGSRYIVNLDVEEAKAFSASLTAWMKHYKANPPTLNAALAMQI